MIRDNSFIAKTSLLALLLRLIGGLGLVFVAATSSYSRDATFVWTANPENVDGYKLYYKTGSSGPPYDGAGAGEGSSPVLTGKQTSFTLTNLSDTETYYFALTAFLGAEESDYSTELVLQAGTPAGAGRSVAFVWTANPEGVDGYRLYYKTGSSGAPYNGSGAQEGPSPVETGNTTTYTLTGLLDTETYYFALTAYQGTTESDYSGELVLAPSHVNSPPAASGTTISAVEDIVYSGQLSASDADGDPLTYSIVSNGSIGNAAITDSTTGSFTYRPNSNVNGSDTFTFKVNDGTQDSQAATVNVSIAARNDVPTVSGGSVSTSEDTPVSGQLSGADVDGDDLTFIIVNSGSLGSATLTNPSSGGYTYVPNSNATGTDSFSFQVSDGTALSSTATVDISISAVNDPPVAESASFSVDEDTPRSGQLTAADPDGDSLIFSIVTDGSKGTVSLTNPSTGAFTYSPNTNESGTDTFTFRVNDGTVDSAPATVSIIISAQNDSPVAVGSSLTTNENSAVSGQLSGSDPDGDALTFTIVSNGTIGNAVITNPSTGAFTYTPENNANGNDSFTFRVGDGFLSSNTATVNVSITSVNDPPAASGTTITTNEDTAYTGQLSATDIDGDSLTFSIVSSGTKGNAVITDPATGAYTYTPSQDENGSDSFTFIANDGTVNSDTATILVTIAPVNDPPVAAEDSVLTDENTAYTGQLSATDADGDILTYSIVTDGTKGRAEIADASNGNFIYTPNANEYGSDSFTYRVNDGTVNSAEATVSVMINLVNEAPSAADISLTTNVNTEVTGRLLAYDPDGDNLTFSIATNGNRGNAVITDAGGGAFVYTPNADQAGDDTFTFLVNDGFVDSAEATVTVKILDGTVITAVFGDNYGVDYPGTVGDTYAGITGDTFSTLETLRTHSQAAGAPHKVSNTVVMKVDLSEIPTYATIIDAKLILYQAGATGEPYYTNSVHKIIGVDPVIAEVTGFNAASGQVWTPVTAGLTYNNIPLGVADIEPMEDEQLLFNQPDYRTWRVTSMVQDWVAEPATNSGLLLKGMDTEVETGRVFASSENSNTALRPQVIVHYKLIPRAPRLILIEEVK